MAKRSKFNSEKAIEHLKGVYQEYLKKGGKPGHFTIRHYNENNTVPQFYIDVYVKKVGGWNVSLQKANIAINFRQYKNISPQELIQYVKKVYRASMSAKRSKGRSKQEIHAFHMADYTKYGKEVGNKYSLAVVLNRFGTWSGVLRKAGIPISRSRGLTLEQVENHVRKVYRRFHETEGNYQAFSKFMYDKYNISKDIYISSKLIERRYGSWLAAKRKMKLF